MAQSTKTSKGSGGRSKSSSSRPKRSSNGSRSSNSRSKSRNGSAVDTAKETGRDAVQAASKAKVPLIAGATAIAGAAVGALVKSRVGSGNGAKGPLKRIGSAKPARALGKIDLDSVKTAADQLQKYGRQASDIAQAVEKTRKKN
jgi:hypothetical protein